MAMDGGSLALLRRGGGLLLDALLPPQCLKCQAPVDRQGLLCPNCWTEVNFIVPPYCAVCGLPFPHDAGPEAICGACAREAPPFHRARAATVYDDGSRALLLGFKHGDRTEAAAAFGQWLARAGADQLAESDLIAPVPLHRWRLWRRRYNQAGLLADALARRSAKRAVPDLLLRRRATKSQKGLSPSARRLNVRGAFAVAPKHGGSVAGARVLLIDDVMTTGATVSAAARCLLRAGAARVEVLTLSRVARAGLGIR